MRAHVAISALAVVSVMVTLTLTGPNLPAASADSGWPIRDSVAATPEPGGDLQVRGSGWGHGVGMSQYGARAQATAGRSYGQILAHYYPGTSLGARSTGDPDSTAGAPISVGLVTAAVSVQVRALDGPVQWLRCEDACRSLPELRQSQGEAFTVIPRTDGGFTVQRGPGGEVVVPGGSGVVLVADHDGTTVEGPNPNTPDRRAEYRRGRMEFHVRSLGSTTRLAAVQRVPSVEDYLLGLAEMPSSWPSAALRSQAVAGRNYALRAIARTLRADCRCHLLASPADQAYVGYRKESETRWVRAVQETAGRVVLDANGQLAQTFYSSSHGGRSEAIEDSWAFGSVAVPYLRSVDDPWSVAEAAQNPRASWSATLPADRLQTLVSSELVSITRVQILDRTPGGTPRTLRLTGSDGSGNQVRIDWPSGGKPAGARLRAAYGGSVLPSQQLSSVEVVSTVPFTDIVGSGHERSIAFAYEAGITKGVSSTRYAPAQGVTREQMASFLGRTFDLPAGAEVTFGDVEPGSTHASAIGSLAAAGITQGCAPGRFCPREPVSREQMASFLSRALGLTPAGEPHFRDVAAGSTHADAVAALAEAGLTAGCTAELYCPREVVTRGQMATFLHRAVRSR